MNTLNKILTLCKISGCELSEDKNSYFTLYSQSIARNVIVAKTDLNEVLHCLRQYLKDPITYFKDDIDI